MDPKNYLGTFKQVFTTESQRDQILVGEGDGPFSMTGPVASYISSIRHPFAKYSCKRKVTQSL